MTVSQNTQYNIKGGAYMDNIKDTVYYNFKDSPCNGCNERWVDSNSCKNCHSSCRKYLIYKTLRSIKNERIHTENEINQFCHTLRENQSGKSDHIALNKKRKQLYKTV